MKLNWTRAEMLLCLCYYASLSPTTRRNPPRSLVEELSRLTGRSPGSISLRFQNFTAVDPELTSLGRKGMTGGGMHVHQIWNEFCKNDGELDLTRMVRDLGLQLFLSRSQNQELDEQESI